MKINQFVSELNDRFFDGALSVPFQEQLKLMPFDRPDVFAFVERMFGFIKKAGIPATDLSVLLGEVLGTLLARILPGAWDGRVPPITLAGRHAAIDQYIGNNRWLSNGNKSMLDIGCGFPPYTTLDSATALPEWKITGADPSLPHYLVHDSSGNYATFDELKSTVYFQPATPTIEEWNLLLKDPKATNAKFEKLLISLLQNNSTDEDGLPRLEINPIEAYESNNLSFVHGGIGQADVESVHVIRCFNVLFYFDNVFFNNALDWFSNQLHEGGILLVGGNWAASTESYYGVYQKNGSNLINRSFCFSIDSICPFSIASWYANYDDDHQTAELTKYVATIRKDKVFMNKFYDFHDAQRKKYGLCPRDNNGYYGIVDPAISPDNMWPLVGQMLVELNAAGFNQMAADVLHNAGYNAQINEVGHIEIIF